MGEIFEILELFVQYPLLQFFIIKTASLVMIGMSIYLFLL